MPASSPVRTAVAARPGPVRPGPARAEPPARAVARAATTDAGAARRLVLTFLSCAAVVMSVLLTVPAGSSVLDALGVTAIPLLAGLVAGGAVVLLRAAFRG